MIGSMLGIYEGRHFEVDVWPRLSPRPQAALRLLSNIAVLAFALVFVYAGWHFTQFAWNRISELAELPLWLIHMVFVEEKDGLDVPGFRKAVLAQVNKDFPEWGKYIEQIRAVK